MTVLRTASNCKGWSRIMVDFASCCLFLARDFDPWDYQACVSRSGGETSPEGCYGWGPGPVGSVHKHGVIWFFLDLWYGEIDHEKLRRGSLAQVKAIEFFAHCWIWICVCVYFYFFKLSFDILLSLNQTTSQAPNQAATVVKNSL